MSNHSSPINPKTNELSALSWFLQNYYGDEAARTAARQVIVEVRIPIPLFVTVSRLSLSSFYSITK